LANWLFLRGPTIVSFKQTPPLHFFFSNVLICCPPCKFSWEPACLGVGPGRPPTRGLCCVFFCQFCLGSSTISKAAIVTAGTWPSFESTRRSGFGSGLVFYLMACFFRALGAFPPQGPLSVAAFFSHSVTQSTICAIVEMPPSAIPKPLCPFAPPTTSTCVLVLRKSSSIPSKPSAEWPPTDHLPMGFSSGPFFLTQAHSLVVRLGRTIFPIRWSRFLYYLYSWPLFAAARGFFPFTSEPLVESLTSPFHCFSRVPFLSLNPRIDDLHPSQRSNVHLFPILLSCFCLRTAFHHPL